MVYNAWAEERIKELTKIDGKTYDECVNGLRKAPKIVYEQLKGHT